MLNFEERVQEINSNIENLHESITSKKWGELDRDGFVFELERAAKKLKEVNLDLDDLNRNLKLLIEKNTPDFSDVIKEISVGLGVLEKNLVLEKTKKLREGSLHETDKQEVPELYSSLQNKCLALTLKARYSTEKAKTFLEARKVPFVKKGSTAKALIEILQRKEEELFHARQNILDMKRKSFLGTKIENTPAEIEKTLQENDKALNKAVSEASSALKTHYAQMGYVEGSFSQLKQRIESIEALYKSHEEKSSELIMELKKERDQAKTIALEIEQETLKTKSSYNTQILSFEEQKQEIEERIKAKYEKDFSELKKMIEEKNMVIKNMNKLISEQENKIKGITQTGSNKKNVEQKNEVSEIKSLGFEKREEIEKPELEDFTGPFVKDPKWLKELERKPQGKNAS